MIKVKPIKTKTMMLANILVTEGYIAFDIEDKSSTRRLFGNESVWWFPEIGFLIGLDSNLCMYVSKLPNSGAWSYKKNWKGRWQRMDEYNPTLVNTMEELYIKYINHVITEEY